MLNELVALNQVELAKLASDFSINILKDAVGRKGYAIWILAGGSTPTLAYKYIAEKYRDALDWHKVYFLLGDERSVDFKDDQSNGQAIDNALLSQLAVDRSKVLFPPYTKNNVEDASAYTRTISNLFESLGSSDIDLLWLGIGEDGHTLSLFPGLGTIEQIDQLVLPVDNSPKPPMKRISLSLKALKAVSCCAVLVSGHSKRQIFERIKQNDRSLPIIGVTSFIKQSGGKVSWFVDKEASP